MATPEQNALLALQLFGAPAAQFNAQNDARTNLLYRLTESQGADQLKKQMADDLNRRYVELENLRATNSQALADKAAGRQDTQLAALQTREDAKTSAADLKQLRNTIAATYPKYAAEATRMGEDVRAITDFDESWAGLGDLQAEMARLEQTRVKRDQDAAAEAAVGELDDAAAAVKEHQKNLETVMKPHPEDEKFARSRATQAVQQALEMGGVSGAPKANSTAAKNGLAALSKGDIAEANSLLGSEALSSYDSAYQTAMQAAPNFKNRMQAVTVAQQNFQIAQRNFAQIQSDLRKAAATNSSLATKITSRRSALQDLMAPDDTSVRQPRTFDQLTPPPPAPAGAPTTSAPSQPGVINRGLSALMGIGFPGFDPNANLITPGNQPLLSGLASAGRALGGAATSPMETVLQALESLAAKRRAALQAPSPVDFSAPGDLATGNAPD